MTQKLSNKALFDYWYDRVEFKNTPLLASPGHLKTFELRHQCTNYDALWQSAEVQNLPDLERDRMVAIIKYECTARVLQRRATALREQVSDVENSYREIEKEYSRLRRVLRALQEKLFGKDQENQQLQHSILSLKRENEALQAELEESKAYSELLEEFEKLQKAYDKVEKRKKELAKNNMSLGGRVAHTRRFKRERDESREILAEQKEQIAELKKYNQALKLENQALKVQTQQAASR